MFHPLKNVNKCKPFAEVCNVVNGTAKNNKERILAYRTFWMETVSCKLLGNV